MIVAPSFPSLLDPSFVPDPSPRGRICPGTFLRSDKATYRVDFLIADAGQAEVYRVQEVAQKHFFAAKVYKTPGYCEHETKILERLSSSPHTIRLHDKFVYSPEEYIKKDIAILSLAPCPDVFETCINTGSPFFKRKLLAPDLLRLANQVLKALASYVELGVIHHDIKLENILFDLTKNEATVIDFGSAQTIENRSTVIPDDPFAAPEMRMCESYGPKVDIWSLSCTLFALYLGKNLFSDYDFEILNHTADQMGHFPESWVQELLSQRYPDTYDPLRAPTAQHEWKNEMREKAKSIGESEVIEVEKLIDLMEQMFKYDTRVSAAEALELACFKD